MGSLLFNRLSLTLALVLSVCVQAWAGPPPIPPKKGQTPRPQRNCQRLEIREIAEGLPRSERQRDTNKNRPLKKPISSDHDVVVVDESPVRFGVQPKQTLAQSVQIKTAPIEKFEVIVVDDESKPRFAVRQNPDQKPGSKANQNVVSRSYVKPDIDNVLHSLELDDILEKLDSEPPFRKPHSFGSQTEADIKTEKSRKIEASWKALGKVHTAVPSIDPKTYIGHVNGFKLPIGDTEIQIPEVRYQELLSEAELLDVAEKAKLKGISKLLDEGELDDFVMSQLELHLVKAAKERLGLEIAGEPMSGATRVHVKLNSGELLRLYKNFTYKNEQLHYSNPLNMCLNIQHDITMERISRHIEETAVKAGKRPPWKVPVVSVTEATINGTYRVQLAPGKEAAEYIDYSRHVSNAAVWESLEAAKKARDEIDPLVIALRRRRFTGFIVQNLDHTTGKWFDVGLDPNNGHNYIWDEQTQTLWAVDH